MTKRSYRGTAQAEVAALTRQRIMASALRLYEAHWMDQVTLQRIADEAGVTVQTILRHFASKEGLELAVAATLRETTQSERDDVAAGDLAGALAYLVEHYESVGDRMIRLLAQEERYPPLKELMAGGRALHHNWVSRVFSPLIEAEPAQQLRIAQLTAICDVYVWKLLRRDLGLNTEEYRAALHDMIVAVINATGA